MESRYSSNRYTAGKSTATFTPPDLYEIELRSPFTSEDVDALFDLFEWSAKERGRSRVLVDISGLHTVPKYARETARVRPTASIEAMAVTGGTFAVRVAMQMLFTAIRLIRPKSLQYPVSFFERREDGLAWLEAQKTQASR